MKRHGTVYNLTWGRDTAPETVDRFAAMVDADWFVTGHQPCDDGFRLANHRQVIIDGTDPYPAYCLFPTNDPINVQTLLRSVRDPARGGDGLTKRAGPFRRAAGAPDGGAAR